MQIRHAQKGDMLLVKTTIPRMHHEEREKDTSIAVDGRDLDVKHKPNTWKDGDGDFTSSNGLACPFAPQFQEAHLLIYFLQLLLNCCIYSKYYGPCSNPHINTPCLVKNIKKYIVRISQRL